MKYLLSLALLLAGCGVNTETSASLVEKAHQICKDVPELDLKQARCHLVFYRTVCRTENYDLRICGVMERL